MNEILLVFAKLMAWGNPDAIERINRNKKEGFWESFGWKKENSK